MNIDRLLGSEDELSYEQLEHYCQQQELRDMVGLERVHIGSIERFFSAHPQYRPTKPVNINLTLKMLLVSFLFIRSTGCSVHKIDSMENNRELWSRWQGLWNFPLSMIYDLWQSRLDGEILYNY